MTRFAAIALDFAGTLTLTQEDGTQVRCHPQGLHLRAALAAHGTALPFEAASAFDHEYPWYRELGDTDALTRLITHLGRFGLDLPVPAQELAVDVLQRAGDHPVCPRAARAVQRWHAQGYRTLLASNTVRTRELRQRTLAADGLDGIMTLVLSSEVGARKPADGFYPHLIDAAGVPPERILMAGDRLIHDALAPASWGMAGVLVDTRPERGQADRAARMGIPVVGHVAELDAVLGYV